MLHRLYFSPGMFGFGRLASFDYFAHLERGLTERFGRAGQDVETYVLTVPPTASLPRRAARLAELVARTCEHDDGPVHLVGHSTGGLDARLVASPEIVLPVEPGALHWMPRLASVTMMNAPHFGTPLAGFFATVSGQRILYALSALTFIALALGTPPLAITSALVLAVGRLDRLLGVKLGALDRMTDALLRLLDANRGREVRAYLEAIKEDQGAVIQITPEAMDLFQAGVSDRPEVLYQSIAGMVPPPSPARLARTMYHPWRAASAMMFATIQSLTALIDPRYPCTPLEIGAEADAALERAFGRPSAARANDGVVPLRSQLWGRIAWVGYADHLDVLGHFADDAGNLHNDWMSSGAGFDRARFAELLDAMAAGMLEGTGRRWHGQAV